MGGLQELVQAIRSRARAKRAAVFRQTFVVGPNTRILDIGSEDGSAVAAILAGSHVQPSNVYIADIKAEHVAAGQRRFGFGV